MCADVWVGNGGVGPVMRVYAIVVALPLSLRMVLLLILVLTLLSWVMVMLSPMSEHNILVLVCVLLCRV